MKGLIVLAFFSPAFFCSHTAATQDSASRFSIVLSPALFVPVTVAIQPGIVFRINQQWALLAEGAIPAFYPKGTEYESISYWRTGIEIKYFLKKKKGSGKYFSWQNNYLYRKLVQNNRDFYFTKAEKYSFQNAIISSPVFSSALKTGIEGAVGKHVYADIFFGAGIRLLFTGYRAEGIAPAPDARAPDSVPFGLLDGWIYNYTLARVHITAGIRIGIDL